MGKTARAQRPQSETRGRRAPLGRRAAKRPHDVDALYSWFDSMVDERGAAEALRRLEAFATARRAHQPWMALGYAAFGVGRSRLGLRAFRRAQERGAGEPAMYGLAVGLTVSGKPREAIRILERERAKSPLGGRLATALADACLAAGAPAKAAKALTGLSAREAREWKDMVDSAKERVARSTPRAKAR